MDFVQHLLLAVLADFVRTIQVNWPYLTLAVVIAATLRTYVGTDKIRSALSGRPWLTIPAAVLFATITPFCSCGTEAVVLGMMAGSVPWAPIIAFMVSSPLTSPEELVYSAGLFGWSFALYYFVAAIVVGLAAGVLTHHIERTGWLAGQARMRVNTATVATSCCTTPAVAAAPGCAACAAPATGTVPLLGDDSPEPTTIATNRPWSARLKLQTLGSNLWAVARRLVVFFTAFVLLGYLIIELVPNQVFTHFFGDTSPFAVPLAALVGIPFYLNSDASLPLIASLVAQGVGRGVAIAFLITGAGTSVGAIAGSLVIARRRVVGLVIGCLLVGAILFGELAQFVL